ncbi:hypothetical protein FGB62_58g046 [Gracilaria domingensis]|nr:hypothetical protein FGB62_58g046 [Gracilaria domingensis]
MGRFTVRSGALLGVGEAGAEERGEAPAVGDEGQFRRDVIHVNGLAVEELADDIEGVKALVHGDGVGGGLLEGAGHERAEGCAGGIEQDAVHNDVAGGVVIGRRVRRGRMAGADEGDEVVWALQRGVQTDGVRLQQAARGLEDVVLQLPRADADRLGLHGGGGGGGGGSGGGAGAGVAARAEGAVRAPRRGRVSTSARHVARATSSCAPRGVPRARRRRRRRRRRRPEDGRAARRARAQRARRRRRRAAGAAPAAARRRRAVARGAPPVRVGLVHHARAHLLRLRVRQGAALARRPRAAPRPAPPHSARRRAPPAASARLYQRAAPPQAAAAVRAL